MTRFVEAKSAAFAARRKRIAKMYVEEMMTTVAIGRKLGISAQNVRMALIREGILRRPTPGHGLPKKDRPPKVSKSNPLSEHSKLGTARHNVKDPSKRCRFTVEQEAELFKGERFDDHPDPVAGQFVWIHPRAAFAFRGSGVGCAGAMCAAGDGGGTLKMRR